MTPRGRRAVWLLAMGLSLAAAACGGEPSRLTVCHVRCDAEQRCAPFEDVAACHDRCDRRQQVYQEEDAALEQSCLNHGEIRARQRDCFAGTCDLFQMYSCYVRAELNCGR